jgi:hypothetical protein
MQFMDSSKKNKNQQRAKIIGSEGWFRSNDLEVMSLARSHCATSLKE